jgi:tRNA threonylcarbamoyladenosine biosynthesis protein TsaE
MSTDMTLVIESISSDATERIGELLGAKLKGGEVIELASDLGGGKTTLTRGLVRGAGSQDTVASPSFTISKVYQAPRFDIHHFDFYRLQDAGLTGLELDEVLGDPKVVVVVEWGDLVKDYLQADHLTITIKATSNERRELTLTYPKSLNYLIQDLC